MMAKYSELSDEAWTVADLFTKTMGGATPPEPPQFPIRFHRKP